MVCLLLLVPSLLGSASYLAGVVGSFASSRLKPEWWRRDGVGLHIQRQTEGRDRSAMVVTIKSLLTINRLRGFQGRSWIRSDEA